jgi:hypothetical protein
MTSSKVVFILVARPTENTVMPVAGFLHLEIVGQILDARFVSVKAGKQISKAEGSKASGKTVSRTSVAHLTFLSVFAASPP